MKTASKRFSTIACFKPIWIIFSKWVPAPIEGSAQVLTELRLESAIYSKRMKPQLKREVNNETFFTSLKSYYQIDYIAYYTQYI